MSGRDAKSAGVKPRKSGASSAVGIMALMAGPIGWTLVTSCQSSPAPSGGALCAFGEVIPCTGANGCKGTSECLPDLSSYGECICGDAAASDGGAKDSGRKRD